MKDRKASTSQEKYDTTKAFAEMGAAVEILMKAAPALFAKAAVKGKEQQGKKRNRQAA